LLLAYDILHKRAWLGKLPLLKVLGPDVAFSIPGLDQSLELEKIYQIISEIQRFGLFKSSDEISSDNSGVL